MSDTAKAKLEILIEDLANDPDIRKLAQPEEFPTTRGSYGLYLGRIGRLVDTCPLAGDRARDWKLWAMVLIAAGGNAQGIRDALQVAGYGS